MTHLPEAYEGNKPYIFVSYAHKDSDTVLPIIQKLSQRGFRIWYDAGIEPATEWPKYIEDHLKASGCVLAFLSSHSVASKYCRREINYAVSKDLNLLCVYLEDVELLDGLEMQLGLSQAMYYQRLANLDAFMNSLVKAEVLRPCCANPEKLSAPKKSTSAPSAAPVSRSQPAKSTAAKPKQKTSSVNPKFIAIAAAAVVVIVAAILIISGLGGKDPAEPSGDPAGTPSESPSVSMPADPSDDLAGSYAQAMAMIDQGAYSDAYALLGQLNGYEDSIAQMESIKEKAYLQDIRTAKKGDTVYWGSYEQDDDTSNGKEDIAWVVLYEDSGRKLLLSRKGLDSRPFHDTQTNVSWEDCTLRAWLNDDFYWEAFNEIEQDSIVQTVITTPGSEDTRDYVFLLSEQEVGLYKEYCTLAELTDYAVRQGATVQQWWLRSPWSMYGQDHTDWASTLYQDDATVGHSGVADKGLAICPTIWVDTRTEKELEEAYSEALNLFEKKNYKKALTAFEKLGTYKDSVDYFERLPKLILMQPYAEAEVGDEVKLGTCDWIVLDKQEDKILVVSKYSVGTKRFVDTGWEITWDISGVREWLNGPFLSDGLKPGEEKTLILPTQVSTSENPEYGTAGGADVTDLLFLLSYEEVMQYLPDVEDRVITTKEDKTTGVSWWLRTMGKDIYCAMIVDGYGTIQLDGYTTSPFAPGAGIHVRPAMWINTAE